ncbi:hypothetical protein B0H11DRAFT_2256178 [Mycena galericulata]|nr:hypothetical protein B0H11DRAFT_2256178 [Mycena galericulata]
MQYSYNYATPPSTATNAQAPPSTNPNCSAPSSTAAEFPSTHPIGPDGHPTCPLPFFPDGGATIKSVHESSTDKFYVASPARNPGAYTDHARVTEEVKGFRNGRLQGCSTWEEALDHWARMCRQYHGAICVDALRRVTMETRVFLTEQHRVRGVHWAVKGIKDVFETRAGALHAADAADLEEIHIISSRDMAAIIDYTRD